LIGDLSQEQPGQIVETVSTRVAHVLPDLEPLGETVSIQLFHVLDRLGWLAPGYAWSAFSLQAVDISNWHPPLAAAGRLSFDGLGHAQNPDFER